MLRRLQLLFGRLFWRLFGPKSRLKVPLPHRDDVPYEVVEALEKQMAERFPGMKVVFAGDVPGGPPKKLEQTFESQVVTSMLLGTCFSCHTQMEGYPSLEEIKASFGKKDGISFEGPEGWEEVSVNNEGYWFWLCQDCAKPVEIKGLDDG
jgi:hypothetical protein